MTANMRQPDVSSEDRTANAHAVAAEIALQMNDGTSFRQRFLFCLVHDPATGLTHNKLGMYRVIHVE